MTVQTTYTNSPAIAYAGLMIGPGMGRRLSSYVAQGALQAGLVLIKGTTDTQARVLASTDEVSASANAIVTTAATATTVQTISGAGLNGATGAAVMYPPRNITLTLNSHADWDASTALVRGLDWRGNGIEEVFAIPDAGNVTLTGIVCFSSVVEIKIGAQAGTNGSYTVGIGTKLGPMDRRAVGIGIYDAGAKSQLYADKEPVPVLSSGQIWLLAEGTTVKGDPVYVRWVATGSEVRGAVRATPDADDCALLAGAVFDASGTGAGLRPVEIALQGN